MNTSAARVQPAPTPQLVSAGSGLPNVINAWASGSASATATISATATGSATPTQPMVIAGIDAATTPAPIIPLYAKATSGASIPPDPAATVVSTPATPIHLKTHPVHANSNGDPNAGEGCSNCTGKCTVM